MNQFVCQLSRPLVPAFYPMLLDHSVSVERDMLAGLTCGTPASLPVQKQIPSSKQARHVPPTKFDLPPLPASHTEHPPSLASRPDLSGIGAGCSLRLSHIDSSPQTRLYTAQDSTYLRLWRPRRSRANLGTADESTTGRQRRKSGMSWGRGTRRYVKHIGTEFR